MKVDDEMLQVARTTDGHHGGGKMGGCETLEVGGSGGLEGETEIVGEALGDIGAPHVDEPYRSFEDAVHRAEEIACEDSADKRQFLFGNGFVDKTLQFK